MDQFALEVLGDVEIERRSGVHLLEACVDQQRDGVHQRVVDQRDHGGVLHLEDGKEGAEDLLRVAEHLGTGHEQEGAQHRVDGVDVLLPAQQAQQVGVVGEAGADQRGVDAQGLVLARDQLHAALHALQIVDRILDVLGRPERLQHVLAVVHHGVVALLGESQEGLRKGPRALGSAAAVREAEEEMRVPEGVHRHGKAHLLVPARAVRVVDHRRAVHREWRVRLPHVERVGHDLAVLQPHAHLHLDVLGGALAILRDLRRVHQHVEIVAHRARQNHAGQRRRSGARHTAQLVAEPCARLLVAAVQPSQRHHQSFGARHLRHVALLQHQLGHVVEVVLVRGRVDLQRRVRRLCGEPSPQRHHRKAERTPVADAFIATAGRRSGLARHRGHPRSAQSRATHHRRATTTAEATTTATALSTLALVDQSTAPHQSAEEVGVGAHVLGAEVAEERLHVVDLGVVERHALTGEQHLELLGKTPVVLAVPQREVHLHRFAHRTHQDLKVEQHLGQTALRVATGAGASSATTTAAATDRDQVARGSAAHQRRSARLVSTRTVAVLGRRARRSGRSRRRRRGRGRGRPSREGGGGRRRKRRRRRRRRRLSALAVLLLRFDL
mmetsp:Transcript_15671/g.46966  ORF Transcript_15671/g.46966 Transcript_15671/m.46966 type:complete len:612 (-) Transcript_15671:1059-2894(-)